MIVVHGGGFQQELTKRAANTIAECRGWARRGFLALAVEYRRWCVFLLLFFGFALACFNFAVTWMAAEKEWAIE